MATVSDLNLLTGSSTPLLASGDVLAFTDISDPTQSPGGSTVKATMTQFFAAIPAPIIITSTTATQFQVKYDGSNHVTVAVSSAGVVTLTATGASAGFTFANAVTASKNGNNTFTGLAVSNTDNTNSTSRAGLTVTGGTVVTSIQSIAQTNGQIGTTSNHSFKVFANSLVCLTANTDGSATFSAGISATTGTFSGALGTATTQKLGLNAGLTTYFTESSAGIIKVFLSSTESLRFDGGAVGSPLIMLFDGGVGLKSVQYGAADSGGAGFRLLRISN